MNLRSIQRTGQRWLGIPTWMQNYQRSHQSWKAFIQEANTEDAFELADQASQKLGIKVKILKSGMLDSPVEFGADYTPGKSLINIFPNTKVNSVRHELKHHYQHIYRGFLNRFEFWFVHKLGKSNDNLRKRILPSLMESFEAKHKIYTVDSETVFKRSSLDLDEDIANYISRLRQIVQKLSSKGLHKLKFDFIDEVDAHSRLYNGLITKEETRNNFISTLYYKSLIRLIRQEQLRRKGIERDLKLMFPIRVLNE